MAGRSGLSGALRFPVASPWKLRRHGQPTAYLSARQATLLLFLQRPRALRRRWTLEQLCRWTGIPSRGQAWHELRRLRQLELIGIRRCRRGPHGDHRIFIPRARWVARALVAGRRLPRDNDSASTPSGFISSAGVAAAERNRAAPPGSAGSAGLTGPRRGRPPPRVLYAECPSGHRTRIGRGSWRRDGPSFHGSWRGLCGRCRRPIEELVDLAIAVPARPRSPDELADPERFERRRRLALETIADPATSYGVRQQLLRDYGPPPAPTSGGVFYTVTRRYQDGDEAPVVRRERLAEPGLAGVLSRVAPRGGREGGP